jgi:5-methylcytosine-specific restriction endonuclease McrA
MIETKTAAEILALNTAGQREYAKQIGVKRAATDTKATIAAKLMERTLEIEKEQAPAAPVETPAAPKASKSRKICSICKTRPVGTGVHSGYEDKSFCKEQGYCLPCGDEGQHEISHDNGHEGIPTDECWLCHPELNRAKDTYVPRKATTSKLGMVILAKGTYVHKSEMVKAAIEKLGGSVKITGGGETGLTRLVGKLTVDGAEWTIIAEWTGNAFHYAGSSLNGGKFRNVKELFRELGI